MKIAYIHYHLETGGVTTVVCNQAQLLLEAGHEVLVLSSSKKPPRPIPHLTLPDLAYRNDPNPLETPLEEQVLSACHSHWQSLPDLIHLHNPTLGKNTAFTPLIAALAASKIPLILQLHDFAEDNRPTNYQRLGNSNLYPVAPQIHYTFLNSRDHNCLLAASLPKEQAHYLPNSLSPLSLTRKDETPRSQTSSPLILYPVRAIPRKNIAELLFLAALAPKEATFAISLAPSNSEWLPLHDELESFAKEHNLPVLFNVTDRISPTPSLGTDFQSWIKAASHLVTTSLAEGFGYAFLEPAAHNKPLFGRDLPLITSDLKKLGFEPGKLYPQLPVSLSEFSVENLKEKILSNRQEHFRHYGQNCENNELENYWLRITTEHTIDFSLLPLAEQKKIILLAKGNVETFPSSRRWLAEALKETEAHSSLAQLNAFLPEAARERLLNLYQKAITSPRKEPSWLSRVAVLQEFLSLY